MIYLLPVVAVDRPRLMCLLCHESLALGLAHDLVSVGGSAQVDGCCVCIPCGGALAADATYAERAVCLRLRWAARRVTRLRKKGAGARSDSSDARRLDDAEMELRHIRELAGHPWVCLGLEQGLWGVGRLPGPWSDEQRALLAAHVRNADSV